MSNNKSNDKLLNRIKVLEQKAKELEILNLSRE